ncbi:lamin tail domain-containing protein [Curtobacterium flaccumfaciens]|nr:lamin tail domain-containing protein [Curtobacterium flaccumfaciens]
MRAPALRPPMMRIGAAVAAALVVAAGVVTASPALAAVGDDDPSVGAVAANGLVVNEVESNADDTDWVELENTSDAAIDLTGYAFLDSDSSHDAYVLPAGSTIAAGGYFVVDQLSATAPGFDFGLGGADTARLYDPAGDLVLQVRLDDPRGCHLRPLRRRCRGRSWTPRRRPRGLRTTAPHPCASTRSSRRTAPPATGWS